VGAKLHFRYASMNAGKSTQLLQIAHNYGESDRRVMLFTAAIDHRAGTGVIASRLGAQSPALTFDAQTDFRAPPARYEGVSCILIDEAQFLSKAQVQQLHQVAAVDNVPVMCFGLRTDFQGEPFEGATHLLALAEDIQEIKAICTCGRKSTMNLRLDEDGQRVTSGEQVLIGGNHRYRQVCARCFYI
jgi:thymidine kinase